MLQNLRNLPQFCQHLMHCIIGWRKMRSQPKRDVDLNISHQHITTETIPAGQMTRATAWTCTGKASSRSVNARVKDETTVYSPKKGHHATKPNRVSVTPLQHRHDAARSGWCPAKTTPWLGRHGKQTSRTGIRIIATRCSHTLNPIPWQRPKICGEFHGVRPAAKSQCQQAVKPAPVWHSRKCLLDGIPKGRRSLRQEEASVKTRQLLCPSLSSSIRECIKDA